MKGVYVFFIKKSNFFFFSFSVCEIMCNFGA